MPLTVQLNVITFVITAGVAANNSGLGGWVVRALTMRSADLGLNSDTGYC